MKPKTFAKPLPEISAELQGIRAFSSRLERLLLDMSFEVLTPHSVIEALDILASSKNVVPLAGGTDLMVSMHADALAPCTFLNLQELAELRTPLSINGGLTIGALTTYRDVRRSSIGPRFP